MFVLFSFLGVFLSHSFSPVRCFGVFFPLSTVALDAPEDFALWSNTISSTCDGSWTALANFVRDISLDCATLLDVQDLIDTGDADLVR